MAQTIKSKALKIGDRVPEVQLALINSSKQSAKLSDYRGKLVILDFWATWCGSCLTALPKMDSLQKKFNDRVKVLMVNTTNTGDNITKINDFLKKWKTKFSDFQLPSAINDSVLYEYFPHRELPHYVWISADGRVKAITESKKVTAENIIKALGKQPLSMPEKKDFFSNRLLDLGQEGVDIDEDLAGYSIFKKGKLENLTTVNQLRFVKSNDGKGVSVRGKAMRNMPLLEMYKEAIRLNKSSFRSQFTNKRLFLEIGDTSLLGKENLYTYDIVVPENEADSLYSYIIRDLNHYSNYIGGIEKRNTKCLVLIRTSTEEVFKSKGGDPVDRLNDNNKLKVFRNNPISLFILRLNWSISLSLPVIDETNYKGNIDLEFSANFTDFAAVRKGLQNYGLDLVETERELDVFVIKDKRKRN